MAAATGARPPGAAGPACRRQASTAAADQRGSLHAGPAFPGLDRRALDNARRATLRCFVVGCGVLRGSHQNRMEAEDTGEFEQAIALVDELGRLQNIRVSDAHGICENDKSPLKLGDAGKAAHGSIGDLRPSSGVPLQLRSKACSVRPQSMDATAAVVLLAYIEAYTVWQTDLNSARITPVPLADAPEVPSCRTSSISGGWIRTSADTWGPADICGCHGAS